VRLKWPRELIVYCVTSAEKCQFVTGLGEMQQFRLTRDLVRRRGAFAAWKVFAHGYFSSVWRHVKHKKT
jgi:hypothetical protein